MEHLVVRSRKPVARELLFEEGVQVPVQVEVGLPDVVLLVVEPSRLRHCSTVPSC